MRTVWKAAVFGGIVVAAVAIPVGAALTPGSGPATAPQQSEPPFPSDAQLAARKLGDPALDELSGLAASRLHPGVLFGINDSGSGPVVYAIDQTGATVARFTLDGARARDWEALAPGVGPSGEPVLWIADIGDNRSNQDTVGLLRIAEPRQLVDSAVAWDSFRITYEDGPHNAEALLVDPRDGAIAIVTKGDEQPGAMYAVVDPLRNDRTNVLQRVREAPRSVTDGAWELSPEGEPRLVITDYWRLHRLDDGAWTSVIGPLQLQREALAWPWLPTGARNDLVLLGSEGAGSSIVVAKVP